MAAKERTSIPIEITALEAIKPVSMIRILIAEDDALIGLFLAELLESRGYDICAITATEADTVVSAARYQPDIMIIDAHLGNGSGLAALETILRNGFIPHIFVSGDPSSILSHMPAAAVIQKPFRETELIIAIEGVLAAKATF